MRYPQKRRVIYTDARIRQLEKDAKRGRGSYNAMALIILAALIFGLIIVAGNVAKQHRLSQKYSDSP